MRRDERTSSPTSTEAWEQWEQEAEQEAADRRMRRHVEQVRSLLPNQCGSGRKLVAYYSAVDCKKCEGTGMYREYHLGHYGGPFGFRYPGQKEDAPAIYYTRVELSFCGRCKGVGRHEERVSEEEPWERRVIRCMCCGEQLQEGEECVR